MSTDRYTLMDGILRRRGCPPEGRIRFTSDGLPASRDERVDDLTVLVDGRYTYRQTGRTLGQQPDAGIAN
jgi:hypothetical protein